MPRSKGTPVLKITQSPLNAARWCFDLECGHEQWTTSFTRPTKTRMFCRTCDDAKKVKRVKK